MIHPSYSELMQEVNKETEIDEPPVVNSRYSIVLATSKRARQIIGGDTPLVPHANGKKPLSVAIEELYRGEVKIMPEDGRKDEGGLTEMEALQEDMEEMVQENAEIENSGVEDAGDADIAEEYDTEEISALH